MKRLEPCEVKGTKFPPGSANWAEGSQGHDKEAPGRGGQREDGARKQRGLGPALAGEAQHLPLGWGTEGALCLPSS